MGLIHANCWFAEINLDPAQLSQMEDTLLALLHRVREARASVACNTAASTSSPTHPSSLFTPGKAEPSEDEVEIWTMLLLKSKAHAEQETAALPGSAQPPRHAARAHGARALSESPSFYLSGSGAKGGVGGRRAGGGASGAGAGRVGRGG